MEGHTGRLKPPILVTRVLPQTFMDRMAAVATVDVWTELDPIPADELARRSAGLEGLVCTLTDRIDTAYLDGAPKLRVISQVAVGVDNIDLAACTSRGIPVGHTPEVLTETTADTAVALLLSVVRRLPEGERFIRAGEWTAWDPDFLLGEDVHHTTVGIVGLGRIGTAVARRLRGFDVRLLYYNRSRKLELENELGIESRSLDQLLVESDHVVLTIPLRPETYHLIDERCLRLMKPNSTLVNIARGGVVDNLALAKALREGWIGRAALDVTEPEPIPTDHPLVGLDQCLIIPHIGSASYSSRDGMSDLAVDNLVAGLAGERLPKCVNSEVYDRQ